MIKFKALIHKKSRVVIYYDFWASLDNEIKEVKYSSLENDKYTFVGSKLDMLVSDEFEVIYDNEFTYDEYCELMRISIHEGIGWLREKAVNKIKDIDKNSLKYGIDFDL